MRLLLLQCPIGPAGIARWWLTEDTQCLLEFIGSLKTYIVYWDSHAVSKCNVTVTTLPSRRRGRRKARRDLGSRQGACLLFNDHMVMTLLAMDAPLCTWLPPQFVAGNIIFVIIVEDGKK